MATYFGLAVFVGNGSYTSTSSIPNWSTIRPTYFSYNYNGTKSYFALDSSNWATSIYTHYNGRQYAIYVMNYDDSNTQQMLTRVGTNSWLHNDSVTTPDSYSVNVNNKKHVYLYEADTPFQNLTVEYKGVTNTAITNVFHFDAYWNFWKSPEYGTPYYGLYKGVIDILTNPTMNEIDSHRDNGYLNGPGNNGLTFVELKYTQDDLSYHSFHVGILPPNHTLQSNYAGLSSSNTTYGSKNIYCFNIKSKLTTSNPAMTVSTNNTKTHLLYAIYNGGKNNYNYNVGFWGTTSGSTVTNPAHGLYNYSNIAFDTWGKYVLTGDTIGEYYAINVDGTRKFILQEIPIKLGKKYTFTIWGDGRQNYDGVVLGKTTLSAGSYTNTLANVFGSNTNVLGYGSFKTGGNQITVTYTPDADRTIYMYVKKSSTASTSYQSYNGTTFGSVCVNTEDLPAYTVTLNKNGGTGGTDSVSIVPGTAAADYPAITLPTRSGYTFLGYYDAQNGGTAYYNAAGQGTKVFDKVNSTIFYAHWQQDSLPTITVTLNDNGGSGGQGTASVVSGQMIGTVTVPSRTGFTFLGYYSSVSSNASGNKYIDNSGTGCKAISSAMTLYALWQNDVVYNPYDTVGIDPEIIYSTSSQSVTIANSAGSCGGGTLTYTDEAEEITISNGGKTATIPGRWGVGTYVLSLDVASPTSATTNGYFGVTRSFDILIIINQATPTFELQGASVVSGSTAQAKVRTSVPGTVYWGTSSSSMTNTMSISASQATTLVNLTNATNSTAGTTVTIYARFVPTDTTNYDSVSTKTATLTVAPPTTTTIVITLNDNGGSGGSGSIVVQKDSTCSSWPSVSVPTRAGFTFMGYFTVNTATGGSQVYQSSGSPYYGYSTSSNVTIYARWKINISYTHNNISAESATEKFVSDQPGEATSTSSTVTFQIDGGQINCVVSSWTISILDSHKASWTINSTGTSFTVPSGVSYTYSPTYFRWQIVVADGTYNNYPYVGNTIQAGYTWETNTPRPIYYNLKKVEYVKDSNNNIIKYKAINGAEGFNLTSTGTPNISTGSFSSPYYFAYEYDTYVYSYTLTNERSWYQKYTNGTWDSSLKTGTYSVYPKWRIISETFTRASDGQVSNIERTHAGDNAVSSQLLIDGVYRTVYNTSTNEGDFVHESMGENLGTDTVVFRLYNPDDTSKYQEVTKSATNSLGTQHYADTNGTTGEASVTANNPTVSIGSGMTAGGTTYGTVTCVCNDTITYYLKYTSNAYTSLQTGTQTATAYWLISSKTYTPDGGTASTTTRFDYRNTSGTSTININGVDTTVRRTGYDIKHTTMAANIGTDSVTVTAYRGDDTTKTATATYNISNLPIWGDVTLTVSPSTPYTATAAGETKTITASATQARTLPSGSSASAVTLDASAITCSVKTSQTWASLNASEKKVTISNNTSTSARSGFVVTVTANGNGGKSASSDRTFNQSAGAKVYGTPTISTYTFSYSNAAAAGATVTPSVSCTGYSQTWTWNGVSGSGGTLTSGQTVTVDSYTTSGTFPSGCSTNSDYSSTGKVVWTNNTSTDVKDATSNVKVKFKINGKASSAKDCSSCKQNAGAKVYANPTVTGYSYANFAAAGEQNKIPTVTYTQAYTWNGVSGSGDTDSYTYDASHTNPGGTRAFTAGTLPTGFTKGTNFATTGAATWGNNTSTSTRDSKSILSVTVTVNSKTSSSFTCTSCKQNAGAKVYANPTVTGYSYANFSAAGENSKYPTVTYTQAYTWNGVSGSGGTDSYTYDSSHTSPGGTRAFTAGTLPTGFTKGTNFATTGRITAASRGTTIGNARNCTSKLSVVVTVNSKASASFTCSGCIQNGNYVTVVAPRASSGTTHITYADIGPGATSAPVTTNGGATYTFTSGSTSTSVPSTTYGSVTYSRTYTLESVQNGFSAVNSSGKLTVTSKGTTVGGPWTSGNVTSVLTVTWTHSSTYSAGGTKSGTMTSTVTCTQTANALTISLVAGTNTVNLGGTTTGTVTASWTSGVTQDVTSSSTYSYGTANKAVVKLGTVNAIVVDEFQEDKVADLGGYKGLLDGYTVEESHVFYYEGTMTYNGTTRYLWHTEDPYAGAQYVLTATNYSNTLLGYAMVYNLNNAYTDSIIAVLGDDSQTYCSPARYKIIDVYFHN